MGLEVTGAAATAMPSVTALERWEGAEGGWLSTLAKAGAAALLWDMRI